MEKAKFSRELLLSEGFEETEYHKKYYHRRYRLYYTDENGLYMDLGRGALVGISIGKVHLGEFLTLIENYIINSDNQ